MPGVKIIVLWTGRVKKSDFIPRGEIICAKFAGNRNL